MSIVIKNAELNDLSSINHLMRLSKGYWGYDEKFLNQFIQELGVTKEYLQNNITKLFYLDEKLIGFYSFIKEKDNTLVLDNFFLHPDYIKQGLGRELWGSSCNTARHLGYDEFILFSDPNAESFYLKLGCFKIGEIPSPMVSNRVNPILKYKLKTITLFHSIENFETDRMIAKRITEGDFEDLFDMHQDEQAMATLGGVRSAKETRENLEWNIKQWENNGFGLWLFRSKTTGKLFGRGGIRRVPIGDAEEIELGFALMPKYWGQGLATEMAKASIEIAFEKLKLDNIVSFTLTTNLLSARVMKKIGFEYERDIELGGAPHVLYRLTAGDYWKDFK